MNVSNTTLKQLIGFAYHLQAFHISGGPAWLGSDAYDIIAKAETDPGPNQLPLMVQSLLSDRFALKFHHETKEMPVFELLVARPQGRRLPV